MDGVFFQIVVDRYYADLYRFAMSLARNPADACDLVQETYAIFAEKGHQIQDPTRAKQWLFTTLYREFTASWRENQRMVAMDTTAFEWQNESHADQAERIFEHHELIDVLRSLPAPQRAILTLFHLDHHNYREIAEILDIPVGTVMSRLSRARAVLKAKLTGYKTRDGATVIPFNGDQRLSENG